MDNKVYERLMAFGYQIETETEEDGSINYYPDAVDTMLLSFISEKVVRNVKAECNTDTVPEELEYKVIDLIVGEFFTSKKNMGQLVIKDMDFYDAEKKIQIGDTTIEFATGSSPSEMFDRLLSLLLKPIDYSDYRCIRW